MKQLVGVAQTVAEHVPEDSNQQHMGTMGRSRRRRRRRATPVTGPL